MFAREERRAAAFLGGRVEIAELEIKRPEFFEGNPPLEKAVARRLKSSRQAASTRLVGRNGLAPLRAFRLALSAALFSARACRGQGAPLGSAESHVLFARRPTQAVRY